MQAAHDSVPGACLHVRSLAYHRQEESLRLMASCVTIGFGSRRALPVASYVNGMGRLYPSVLFISLVLCKPRLQPARATCSLLRTCSGCACRARGQGCTWHAHSQMAQPSPHLCTAPHARRTTLSNSAPTLRAPLTPRSSPAMWQAACTCGARWWRSSTHCCAGGRGCVRRGLGLG